MLLDWKSACLPAECGDVGPRGCASDPGRQGDEGGEHAKGRKAGDSQQYETAREEGDRRPQHGQPWAWRPA